MGLGLRLRLVAKGLGLGLGLECLGLGLGLEALSLEFKSAKGLINCSLIFNHVTFRPRCVVSCSWSVAGGVRAHCYLRQDGGYVITSVCLSVCLSMCSLAQKAMHGFT